MLLGDEPDHEDADALDTTFILYADHTMNASTFTARIIASTLADMFSAITGAIGALKGPLHGGANEEAMKMLEEIGKPENAEAYVRDRLERHEKIMGFGHAVYTHDGPARARAEAALSREVGERHGDARWYEIFEAIERTTSTSRRALNPNVDLYAAGVYHVLGIPTDLMTPDLRARAHGGLDGARARAVRGQQGDPAGLALHRSARPERTPASRSAPEASRSSGRGNRPAPSTTARTRSSRPIPIRCTPATPSIPRMPCSDVDRGPSPTRSGVARRRVRGHRCTCGHVHTRQMPSMNRRVFAAPQRHHAHEHLRPLEEPSLPADPPTP